MYIQKACELTAAIFVTAILTVLLQVTLPPQGDTLSRLTTLEPSFTVWNGEKYKSSNLLIDNLHCNYELSLCNNIKCLMFDVISRLDLYLESIQIT